MPDPKFNGLRVVGGQHDSDIDAFCWRDLCQQARENKLALTLSYDPKWGQWRALLNDQMGVVYGDWASAEIAESVRTCWEEAQQMLGEWQCPKCGVVAPHVQDGFIVCGGTATWTGCGRNLKRLDS